MASAAHIDTGGGFGNRWGFSDSPRFLSNGWGPPHSNHATKQCITEICDKAGYCGIVKDATKYGYAGGIHGTHHSISAAATISQQSPHRSDLLAHFIGRIRLLRSYTMDGLRSAQVGGQR